MTLLVRWHFNDHFRWFRSDGLQDEYHLRNICTIARQTIGVPPALTCPDRHHYNLVNSFRFQDLRRRKLSG
jgi:hypothetical protein